MPRKGRLPASGGVKNPGPCGPGFSLFGDLVGIRLGEDEPGNLPAALSPRRRPPRPYSLFSYWDHLLSDVPRIMKEAGGKVKGKRERTSGGSAPSVIYKFPRGRGGSHLLEPLRAPERCPRGRRSTTGNRIGAHKAPRGFESLPLRQRIPRRPRPLSRESREGNYPKKSSAASKKSSRSSFTFPKTSSSGTGLMSRPWSAAMTPQVPSWANSLARTPRRVASTLS